MGVGTTRFSHLTPLLTDDSPAPRPAYPHFRVASKGGKWTFCGEFVRFREKPRLCDNHLGGGEVRAANRVLFVSLLCLRWGGGRLSRVPRAICCFIWGAMKNR